MIISITLVMHYTKKKFVKNLNPLPDFSIQSGSIFKEAFENAANDPKYCDIAIALKEAHLAAFSPYFLRCESDVMESLSPLKGWFQCHSILSSK